MAKIRQLHVGVPSLVGKEDIQQCHWHRHDDYRFYTTNRGVRVVLVHVQRHEPETRSLSHQQNIASSRYAAYDTVETKLPTECQNVGRFARSTLRARKRGCTQDTAVCADVREFEHVRLHGFEQPSVAGKYKDVFTKKKEIEFLISDFKFLISNF